MKINKMFFWVAGIPVLLILLIVIIARFEPEGSHIARASAYKAAALALADRETIEESLEGSAWSIPENEKNQWFGKYKEYLFRNGYIGGEHLESSAVESFTYGEAAYIAEQVGGEMKNALTVSTKKYGRAMPQDEWWVFYDYLRKAVDPDGAVREEQVLLYGTPANVKEADSWTAYTSGGVWKFEGVALDACTDREIEVLVRGDEIIRMVRVVDETVTYENVWLSRGSGENLKVYVGGAYREFAVKEKELDAVADNLADLRLKKGKIDKITVKNERITGEVLAVAGDHIEIEGYGVLPLADNFKVYKTYGLFAEQKKKDILVGYALQEFVVADGEVCAALTTRSFDAKNIRVLLMDTGFKTIFHDRIVLRADGPLLLSWGDEVETVAEGTVIEILPDDERLAEGRIVLEPQAVKNGIAAESIERAQGTPSYYGTLEIRKEPEGLLLINELDIEDYLTRVVPSEMPSYYEKEALKAQAVCARTYAYRQIQANAYSQYGAHVDDSTNYQVYNNTETYERTDAAVAETYGQLLTVGGELAEAYYFSTSCGYTTDGTLWGAPAESVPYLKAIPVTGNQVEMNLADDALFEEYIKGKNTDAYDYAFPLYRWRVDITNRQLEQKLDRLGVITGLEVTERGPGGIAKEVKVTGEGDTKILSGQTQIRNTLGNSSLVYTKNDGEALSGWDSLPSAFIHIEVKERNEEENTTTFTIWGGGYGHGVGMSQNGAEGMARAGKNYREILEFFYRGAEIQEQ